MDFQEERNLIYAFDREEELATVNLNRTIDLTGQMEIFSKIAYETDLSVEKMNSSVRKYIFPQKQAIAKNYLEAHFIAAAQVILLLQEAIKNDWTLDVLEKVFYILILKSKINFFIAQEEYNNENAAKVQIFHFCLSHTNFLISAWRSLFTPGQQN